MELPGRTYSASNQYRYGFNGKEKDTEGPVQYDYGFRIYDPRLVRFKSVDPLTSSYPELTPYQFAGNSPITFIDLDGLEMAWRNPATGEVKAAGPLALPVGSRNSDGWILFQPPVRRPAASTPAPDPPVFKPTLQQGSDNLASVKAAQNQQVALRTTVVKPKVAYSVTTVSADNRTWYEKQQSEELKQQYENNQRLQNAVMDPFAASVAAGTYVAAREYVTGVVDHAVGVYDGIKDGNYWSAAKNGLFLGLDVAPFLVKGSGAISTEVNAAHNAAGFERFKAVLAQQEIFNSPAVGSALKSDPFHMAGSFVVDDIATKGRFFTIKGGDGVFRNLTQMEGTVNNQKGIFEWIINEHNQLSHQRFIPGGQITGYPNQVVK